MILFFTNARDITTDYVVLELQRRRLAYLRVNTERISEAALRLGFDDADDWSITIDGRTVEGSQVIGAYYRRPGLPVAAPDVQAEAARRYCAVEWATLLKSLYGRLGSQWLNSPAAIALAEDKPRQLLIARSLGFEVPATVVTNAPAVFESFAEAGPTIGKPLRHALLEGEVDRVIFTSRLPRETVIPSAVSAAPMILQREIAKAVDIRVTVVGSRVFAVAIDSQAQAEAEVDWRRGDGLQLGHVIVELPSDITARCVDLVRALDLRFGAIDLVEDREGRHWFLEINPNGQWAWLETRTGAAIASAIVDELSKAPA